MACCRRSKQIGGFIYFYKYFANYNFWSKYTGDLDLTMLCQMSCRGHIDALLHNGLQDGKMNGLANLLQPAVKTSDFSPTPLDSSRIAAVLKKASDLPWDAYDALLDYLQATGHQYQPYDAFPHLPMLLFFLWRPSSLSRCTEGITLLQYFTLPLLFQWIPTDFRQTLPFPTDPADSPLDFQRSPLESIGND